MPNNPVQTYQVESVSIETLFFGLLLAVVLSLVVRWHYLRFSHVFANRAQLANVLPLVATTTLLVITVVKSSLALSLGLVGAMSIVRFRTPIKEPEELAYLFLSIGIGLGAGAGQFVPTALAATTILVLMYALKRYSGYRDAEDYDLFVELDRVDHDSLPADQQASITHRVISAVKEIAESVNLSKLDQTETGTMIGLTVSVRDHADVDRLFGQIRSIAPQARCTFIDHKAVSL